MNFFSHGNFGINMSEVRYVECVYASYRGGEPYKYSGVIHFKDGEEKKVPFEFAEAFNEHCKLVTINNGEGK